MPKKFYGTECSDELYKTILNRIFFNIGVKPIEIVAYIKPKIVLKYFGQEPILLNFFE